MLSPNGKYARSWLLIFAWIISNQLFSQSLNPEKGIAFCDSIIPRIDIVLPLDSLALLLTPGNEKSNYEYHATYMFSDGVHFDTIDNVGFRLRGNTSRTAEKKSYKVSFNTYEPGRKWKNLEKLNLNSEHNDPSVSRAKICWDYLKDMGLPFSRANHVNLYINGQFFGLYLNVENIDEQFTKLRFGNNDGNLYKCLYPADLVFAGDNQELYKKEIFGRRPYELQNNLNSDDYSDLVKLIKILNNTPSADLPCKLESVLEVDNVIRLLAFDVLTANWDGPVYNKNNFYLYKNQKSGKFEMMPFDLDNTLGIDFFNIDWTNRNIYSWKPGNESRPIYSKILGIKAYKDRFSFYLDQALKHFFNKEHLVPVLDSLKEKLSTSALSDPFRPLDYGFSFSDFQNSFSSPLPYGHTPEGILSYVEKRAASIKQELQLNPVNPIIRLSEITQTQNSKVIHITVNVLDDGLVNKVEFCYKPDAGAETCETLHDDGKNNDGAAGDGVYGKNITLTANFNYLTYRIAATDSESNISEKPVCGQDTIYSNNLNSSVVINEIMAGNKTIIPDEQGEFDDWIELYNTSGDSKLLNEYFLTDNKDIPGKWPLPSVNLPANSYLLVWADDDVDQGELHASFKLNNKGEYLGLYEMVNNDFVLRDEIDFLPVTEDLSYGRYPNGSGPFQKLQPTPLANNSTVSFYTFIDDHINIKIFPNPARDVIFIKYGAPIREGTSIRVFNSTGMEILSNFSQIAPNQIKIDISKLPNGLYYVLIHQNGENDFTEKIMIQR